MLTVPSVRPPPTQDGQGALHYAARKQLVRTLESLLKDGADPDSTDLVRVRARSVVALARGSADACVHAPDDEIVAVSVVTSTKRRHYCTRPT